ncbi:MAG: hypothetical protein ACJ8AW_39925 [Rhodopila sp.]
MTHADQRTNPPNLTSSSANEAAKHPFQQESIAAREAICGADGTVAHW